MKYLKSIIFLTLIFLTSAVAQTGDVTKEPGYVDFGSFTKFENSTGVTEVTLDEELLSTIAEISPDDDPNIMEILKGLKLIKANVYEVDDNNRKDLESKMGIIDSKLAGTDWKRIVRSKKGSELANVYVKQNSRKQIVGLVVTSLESSGEAAFVNIVGTIDLKTIGKLGKKFDIPQLEGIKDEK